MTVREWRLLVTESTDGATNMAIDEALWRGRQAGTSPPTVRFFGWDPPTVSLGYGQPLDDSVDVAACRRLGVGPQGARVALELQDGGEHGPRVVVDVEVVVDALPYATERRQHVRVERPKEERPRPEHAVVPEPARPVPVDPGVRRQAAGKRGGREPRLVQPTLAL